MCLAALPVGVCAATAEELAEAWEEGALGSPRVQADGFARAWRAVCDLYDGDLMGNARRATRQAAK